jgi:hypothetical protein
VFQVPALLRKETTEEAHRVPRTLVRAAAVAQARLAATVPLAQVAPAGLEYRHRSQGRPRFTAAVAEAAFTIRPAGAALAVLVAVALVATLPRQTERLARQAQAVEAGVLEHQHRLADLAVTVALASRSFRCHRAKSQPPGETDGLDICNIVPWR